MNPENFAYENFLQRRKDSKLENKEQRDRQAKELRADRNSFRDEAVRTAKQHRTTNLDAHRVAEEMRMEGKGSEDPVYDNSKKNK